MEKYRRISKLTGGRLNRKEGKANLKIQLNKCKQSRMRGIKTAQSFYVNG
jgi:hypothetical protein